ncbi:EAL domain, c-di-GMP-specific phosphodiesterase class I (or its enzymatically inactive variant) [Palleronia marisminoris]|uniref:EAL domain protein n=1 Tax=Palleronia marisminoris TaxID=315423 RepID=A0A1Y5T7Q5_9RHOB|nr:EAL domain-containing protein [Palleronia marisminoris]SFH16824.1 EAL domain, c-di-GMP-specific phosphodiesterase class I (or its enzymatically inactive variant) [Palleronia marisminoris]SLN55706.1 hypothetical protein PAM7066_02667 [Palleronia marisminoris]
MTAILIACLSLAAFGAVFGRVRLVRERPPVVGLRDRVIDAISGRSGALVLFEGSGLDPAVLAGDLICRRDQVIAGEDRFAVHLDAPGRDAEFARWLCRAQVVLEDRCGSVRMGATRTGAGAWPEDHLNRAERALARAKSENVVLFIDDHAPPRALAAEAAAIPFEALPILCAERHELVAVEPVAPPDVEDRRPASPEVARHLFLARLRSGARMLDGDSGARLSLPLPDDLAADPDMAFALVFGLDGCDILPERVTLRVGAGLSPATEAALLATGCTVSTEAPTVAQVGAGPHWLPAEMVRDMDADEAARRQVATILARAAETGAEVHADGVGSRKTAQMLSAMGCTLVSGPGLAPAVPDGDTGSASASRS